MSLAIKFASEIKATRFCEESYAKVLCFAIVLFPKEGSQINELSEHIERKLKPDSSTVNGNKFIHTKKSQV